MSRCWHYLFVVIVALGLAACGGEASNEATLAAEEAGAATAAPSPQPTATPEPEPTAVPTEEPTSIPPTPTAEVDASTDDAVDADGDDLVDDGSLALLELESIGAGVPLDDQQIACAEEFVGTPASELRQNIVDGCFDADEGLGWFVVVTLRTSTIDAISDSELECFALASRDLIEDGEADDDDATVAAAVDCGFYGRFTLPDAGDDYASETIACVDASAANASPTVETEREVLLTLVGECGTAEEREALEENFASQDRISEELENFEMEDVDQVEFQLGFIEGLGVDLLESEKQCARDNLRDIAESDSESSEFVDALLETCLNDERRFVVSAQGVMSPLGQVELTEQDNACILARYEELGRPEAAQVEADPDSMLGDLPVRCGTFGRFVASVADVSPQTVTCIDTEAPNYVEALDDEAGITELLLFCASPTELEALGL